MFRRDAVGRLIAKAHLGPDGMEEGAGSGLTTFAYDLLGRMLHAGNADARVHFRYDPLSRLTEEVQEHQAPGGEATLGRYAWRHAYDALGNRTDSRMPGGRHVQWLYYGSGHLHQIRVDGHVLSDIERDALHQEIERTQGALESHPRYDPLGRILAAQRGDCTTPQPPQPTERETFAFDPAGHLLNPNRGGAQTSGGVGQRDHLFCSRAPVEPGASRDRSSSPNRPRLDGPCLQRHHRSTASSLHAKRTRGSICAISARSSEARRAASRCVRRATVVDRLTAAKAQPPASRTAWPTAAVLVLRQPPLRA